MQEAIKRLHEISAEDYYYKTARDSCIQRFEFSVDTFWKYLAEYIKVKHGISIVPSPKSVFREAKELGIVNDAELSELLDMVDDRNLTSHTYHEELAEKISYSIPDYFKTLYRIFFTIS